jgi:hypothetical protein
MRNTRTPIKTMLATALLAAGLAVPMIGQAGVALDINVGPPEPVVETPPPPPQPGYVWAPGFYAWEGGRHVWHQGRYMPPRPGHHWVADHWDHRGEKYHYEPGHWER